MEKAKIISINYEPSDTIQMQGKMKDTEKYRNAGYYIKENRNGYFVLVKAARLIVVLVSCSQTRELNMKEDVREHYGKKRISQSLVDRFSKDICNGTVSIFLDSHGNYEIK